MCASYSALGSPFTLDERIKIIKHVERLTQIHFENNQISRESAFEKARYTLYQEFIKTYLYQEGYITPHFTYLRNFWNKWTNNGNIQGLTISLFKELRAKWDITMLGYLFEFLTSLRVTECGGKLIFEVEKRGKFKAKTGMVFTPYNICERMVQQSLQLFVNSQTDKKKVPYILDPACGGGAFLISAGRALQARYPSKNMKEIVQDYLYGIDINLEAVFITIIGLWGLIGDLNFDPGLLTNNIIAGNTILARNAPEELKPIVWEKIFQKVQLSGGFDIIIGNPPYIRQERIREFKIYLTPYKTFTPTADLYIYFFEKGIDLLRPHGILTFITSNSFLRTRSARPLRSFLKKNVRILDFYDAFRGVVFSSFVTPCILTLQKDPPSGMIRINENYEIPQSCLEDRAWNFLPTPFFRLFAKMDKCHTTLASYCSVYFCIKPGRVKDLILSQSQILQMNLEESLFQPVLRGMDIKGYKQPVPKVNIFFPYKEPHFELLDWQVISDHFPNIRHYLLDRRESLEKRDDYQRNKDHMQWYELRPCAYYPEFRQPKVLTPDICQTNSFTLDRQGYLCLDTVFMIRPRDPLFPIEFWVGYLNSGLVEFFLKMTSSSLGTKGYRYKKQFLEKVPVPAFSTKEINEIACLSRENLQQENFNNQKDIDHILYHCFNFSLEDIQILQEFFHKKRGF